MGQLTTRESRELDQLEAIVDAFQVAYMDAGQALMVIRDKKLYRHVAKTFEEYAKQRFSYSRQHSYRLIEAYQAVRDTEDILSPNGDKVLESPRTEGVARELAKAESPEKRADLWSAVHKENQGKSPGLISATLVSKVRKWMFPVASSDNGKAPPKVTKAEPKVSTCITHLKGLIATIDTVRCRIDELKKEHRPESQNWQTALDSLDEARKAFARLAR